MKKFLLLFSVLSSSIFFSCNNNDEGIIIGGGTGVRYDSPFKIEIEEVSTPESVSLLYQSPDPCCGLPYRYEIFTDYDEKDVILKCTNLDNLTVDLSKTYVGECINLPNDNDWVVIKDGSYIILHLPFIELTDKNTSSNTYSSVNIKAETEEGIVEDYILISRYPSEYFYE